MLSSIRIITLAFFLLITSPLSAFAGDGKGNSKTTKGGFGLLSGSNESLLGAPYEYESSYELEEGGQRGRVQVTLKLQDSYYTYSTTQPPGGPSATVIVIKTPAVSLAGPFLPDSNPDAENDEVFNGLRIEKHHGSVTWTAPVTFAMPVASPPPTIAIQVDAQVCQEACIPVRGLELLCKFRSYYPSAQSSSNSGPGSCG